MRRIYIYTIFLFILLSGFKLYGQASYCNAPGYSHVTLPFYDSVATTCNYGDNYNSSNIITCGSSTFTKGEDVIYSLKPDSSGYILVDFYCNIIQSGVFIYEGCPDNGYCITYNTNASASKSAGFMAQAKTSYYIMVDNWSNATYPCLDSFSISISEPSIPMPNEQDCNGAIPICTDIYYETNSYSGSGNIANEINPANSCLTTGEINSVWYTLTEQTDGDLNFTIYPNDPDDDYDWAVYNITDANCEDLYTQASLEISCNFVGGSSGNNTTGPNGNSGNQNESVIPVVQGDIYVIAISSYLPNQSGYTLDFSASTAQLFDTIPPTILSDVPSYSCGDSILTLKFSENILCSTVEIADFQFSGTGGSYTITDIRAIGCDLGAEYEKYYSFVVSPPIASFGDFTFKLTGPVTDLCGNIASYPDSITFSIDSFNINTLVVPSECNDSTGEISLQVSGGITPYTYSWSIGGTSDTVLTGLPAGSYIVSVNDQRLCELSDTILLQNENAPILSVASYIDPLCFDSANGEITVSVNSGIGGSYSYLWSDPLQQDSVTAINLIAGYYAVVVSDTAGCSGVIDFVLAQPDSIIVSIEDTIRICAGSSTTLLPAVSGGTAPYNYYWNNGLGNSSSQIVTPDSSVTYTVYISDVNNCYSYSQNSVVAFYDSLTVSISGPTNLCSNDTIELSAITNNGGYPYNFTWNNGDIDSTISISPDLDISVSVVVSDQCNNVAYTETDIRVNESPSMAISASQYSGCVPFQVEFYPDTVQNITTYYTWTLNDSLLFSNQEVATYDYTQSGVYDITIQAKNSNGCEEQAQYANYIQAFASPIAGYSYSPALVTLTFPECQLIDLSDGADQWEWVIEGNTFSYDPNTFYTFSDTGAYNITQFVYNSNNCVDSISRVINVLPEFSYYIPTAFTPDEDNLNDFFLPIVNGVSTSTYNLKIFDRWGKLLFETISNTDQWDGRKSGFGEILPVGLYIYKIRCTDLIGTPHAINGSVNLIR